MAFIPKLNILPLSQRSLWPELAATPSNFTLYGGTALALRLEHRTSVDFDFFSNDTFDPDVIAAQVPYLRDSERVQVAPNTLTCRVDRGGGVLVSFFGQLNLGYVEPPDVAEDIPLRVASLRDIAGTKAAVVQKRAEAKDYLDIDALLTAGVGMREILSAGGVVFGSRFNPLITLKALSYFEDVPDVPEPVRARIRKAVESVNISRL